MVIIMNWGVILKKNYFAQIMCAGVGTIGHKVPFKVHTPPLRKICTTKNLLQVWPFVLIL